MAKEIAVDRRGIGQGRSCKGRDVYGKESAGAIWYVR